jgi:hypothetical protein
MIDFPEARILPNGNLHRADSGSLQNCGQGLSRPQERGRVGKMGRCFIVDNIEKGDVVRKKGRCFIVDNLWKIPYLNHMLSQSSHRFPRRLASYRHSRDRMQSDIQR